MSLINQVLKDIDQRGGAHPQASPLDDNVKPIADRAPARSATRLPLLVALFTVIAGGAGWWGWRSGIFQTDRPNVADSPPAESMPMPPPTAATTRPAAPDALETPVDSAAQTPVAAPNSPADLAARAMAGLAEDWAKTLAGPETVSPTETAAAPRKSTPAVSPQVSKVVTASQASDVSFVRAERAFREGRAGEGQRLLRDALAKNASNHAAREWLASVLIELGRNSEAEKWLTEGVALAPERRGFVLPLALLRQQSGNESGALALLESSIELLGDDAEAHAFLAALLQRQNRHTEATEHYLTALRRYPGNARWLVGLGVSLRAQGLRQAAIEAFETALASRSLEPALEALASDQLLSTRQGN